LVVLGRRALLVALVARALVWVPLALVAWVALERSQAALGSAARWALPVALRLVLPAVA
jgi:hypothetical protein